MFINENTSANLLRYRLIDDEEVDEFAVKVMRGGEIPYIFVPGVTENEILIPVSESMPLDVYLRQGECGMTKAFQIIRSTADCVRACERHMLGDSTLVKRLKFAYVRDDELRLACIPTDGADGESDDERSFYRSIISATKYTEDDAQKVISILNFINSDEFTTEELLERLQVMCDVPKEDTSPNKSGVFSRLVRFLFPDKGDEDQETEPEYTDVPSGIHVIAVRRTGEEYPLCFGPDYIGADENYCSICFKNTKGVAGKHARIYFEKNKFYIEDLGRGDTFLNNVKIESGKAKVLSSADLIRVGTEELIFSHRIKEESED